MLRHNEQQESSSSSINALEGKAGSSYSGFGYAIDFSYDGTRIAIGAMYAGMGGQVYVYQAVEVV